MKIKLFNALKQDHSKLGLSDEVLQAYAESLVATGLVTEENLATISKGQEPALKAYQSSIDKERTEKANYKSELEALKAKGGDPKPNPQPTPTPTDELDPKVKAYLDSVVNPIQTELNAYKAKESQAARQSLILGKAKELGIPEWRINEGFTIADDADETAINTTLSGIKQNIVTAGLEGKKNEGTFIPSSNEAQIKESAKAWAEKLPNA